MLLLAGLGMPTRTTDAQAAGDWKMLTSGAGLRSVACATASDCIAVGDYGAIWTSADAGNTWLLRPSGTTETLSGVTCASPSLCIAVGSSTSQSVTLTSSDKGLSWTRRLGPGGLSVICVTEQRCLSVNGSGYVGITDDAGVSWTNHPITNTISFDIGPTSIACMDSVRCVLVGSGSGPDPKTIMTSGDSGLTWTYRLSSTANVLNSVVCPGLSLCVAVGENGVIITSNDGGVTWTTRFQNTSMRLTSVTCPSVNLCLTVGHSRPTLVAIIAASTDGGLTWTSRTPGSQDILTGISCFNSTLCLGAGASSVIATSLDAGDSWNVHRNGSDVDLRGAACPIATQCVAVGQTTIGATVPVSGGANPRWVIGTYANAVSCPTASHCVAVGGGGTAVVSDDGGLTWTSIFTGNQWDLWGIHCPSITRCVAVGFRGTIITSDDGGHTWATRLNAQLDQLMSVSCATTTHCVVVGGAENHTHSTILTSDDGGLNWTPRANPAPRDLWGVSCPSIDVCVAVTPNWNPGGAPVLTSADGGVTWTLRTGPNTSLLGIACVDIKHCVSAGYNLIATTSDGGITWALPVQFANVTFQGTACYDITLCIAVGTKGVIFRGSIPDTLPSPTATATATQTPTSTPTPTRTAAPSQTATTTATPTATRVHNSLTGSFALQGRPGPPSDLLRVPLVVQIFTTANPTPVQTFNVQTENTGTFTIYGFPDGVYDVRVKQAQSLSKSASQLTWPSSGGAATVARVFGMLSTGDVDNNNAVDIVDFSLMRASFSTSISCGVANPAATSCADLDASGFVDIVDFSLLRANFGQVGSQP
jgi:photosystem II stability/assembly factor-like uncharacterized protein